MQTPKSEILYAKPGEYKGNLRIQFTLGENISPEEIEELKKRDDVYVIEKYGEQIYVFLNYTEQDKKHDELLKEPIFNKAKRDLVSYMIKMVDADAFIKAGIKAPFIQQTKEQQ